MSSVVFSSPAKLNLFLDVVNKRPDGFHNIVTLFERINLHDTIRLTDRSDGKIVITCNHPHVPVGSKNLVHKVIKLIQQDLKISRGVTIDIKKQIPVAAGLAGGSSNAATVLLGLNKLWKLRLPQAKLLNYARQIGSDVAFFIYQITWGLGTNRGDVIREIKIPSKLWHVLVIPRVKMYSWKVYTELKLPPTNVLTKKVHDVNILIHSLRKNNIYDLNTLLRNDLESPILRLCPRLLKIKVRLKDLGAQAVMISGSGPCVFGVFSSKEEAFKVQGILRKRFSQVFAVETLK